LEAAAALLVVLRARVIDKNLAHLSRGDAEEVCADYSSGPARRKKFSGGEPFGTRFAL